MRLSLVLLLLAASALLSQVKVEDMNFRKNLNFALELMQQREYYRAITEFKRINSYFPENQDYKSNLYNIAKCYELAGHNLEAINIYKEILKIEKDDWQSIYMAARNYQLINYFYESNDFIDNYLHSAENARRDSLNLVMFINLLNLQDFEKANDFIQEYEASDDLSPKVINFRELMDTNIPLQTKSTTKSLILSIFIPGSGYMYSGKTETGIAALLVNGLFFYVTYLSFKENNTGLGIFTGFFALGFYVGSIYGGVQATKDYNNSLKIEFIKKFNL